MQKHFFLLGFSLFFMIIVSSGFDLLKGFFIFLNFMAESSTTIKQVALHAGVSPATVSRVFSGVSTVDQTMRDRVRAAAQLLNYHPNRIARSLRAKTTQTIGVVVPDIQDTFFTSVVRGIEDVLRRADYALLLGNSDDDLEQEQFYLSTLRADGVAGIIFFPVIKSSATLKHQRAIHEHLPLVALDRAPTGIDVDTVKVTNAQGARDAISYLISLNHRRIALINGPEHLDVPRERQTGYEQAFEAAKIEIDSQLIVYSDFHETGGYLAMRGLLELPTPPTAVFVANNLMALGAMQSIYEQKLRIPDDISVVCFDDLPWLRSFHPPLTAVAQPIYEIGTIAANLMLERLRDPLRPVHHIVLPTKFVVRFSCRQLD